MIVLVQSARDTYPPPPTHPSKTEENLIIASKWNNCPIMVEEDSVRGGNMAIYCFGIYCFIIFFGVGVEVEQSDFSEEDKRYTEFLVYHSDLIRIFTLTDKVSLFVYTIRKYNTLT